MKFKEILNEIKIVLEKVKEEDVDILIDKILNSNTIVTIGAGRVGMAIKGFAMRLGHLGSRSYHIGDTTLPGIAKNDLVIVASGSGETQTIFDLTSIAKKNDATIFCITGNSESRIANLSDYTLIVEAPSKVKEVDGFNL